MNGGPGRNDIMCNKDGKFIKSSSCKNNQICVGPATKEEAVLGTDSLCTTGKILKEIISHDSSFCIYGHCRISILLVMIFFISYDILVVSCGKKNEFFGSCNECPKTNDTIFNSWCLGDCIFDLENHQCKKGKLKR